MLNNLGELEMTAYVAVLKNIHFQIILLVLSIGKGLWSDLSKPISK